MSQETLLIVDDDTNILEVLETRLSAAGFATIKASSAEKAIKLLHSTEVDMVVSDVKMPQMSGIELFAEIQTFSPGLPVIFLTAHGSIQEAVSVVQSGAVDYLTKPFDGKQLVQKVKAHLKAKSEVNSEPDDAPSEPDTTESFIWGETPSMQKLKEMVKRVAASDVNTLILGESGSGKEGIAKAIHDNSKRKNGPYIIVDCGSTPSGILESELFGHTKGSFTDAIDNKKGLIEAAEGGTLFLDEIGNISAEMQTRLLRFLEDKKIRPVGSTAEKQINCRVIAATNADLAEDIEEGNFRQDLYYRLRVITLNIPPLRERTRDIGLLARHFIAHHCKEHNLEPITISDETIAWLENYSWPGNVRELKNSLESATILSTNGQLDYQDLQLESTPSTSDQPESSADLAEDDNKFSLESSEKDAIIRALKETKGIQKRAAELLDISRRSIHYKLKKYDIDPTEFK